MKYKMVETIFVTKSRNDRVIPIVTHEIPTTGHMPVCQKPQCREQTEGHTSPQGSGVKRSHTSCSLPRRTPADCFTGSLIVQIYHPFHWCGLSQRPLKTKEHHPKPDVAPSRVLGEGCHCSTQCAWKTDGPTDEVQESQTDMKHCSKWKDVCR